MSELNSRTAPLATLGCTHCDIPTFRPGLCEACRGKPSCIVCGRPCEDFDVDTFTAVRSRHIVELPVHADCIEEEATHA